MSYVTGTTHYNLPQTVGTDKRDWADTNQAYADIDAAIYGAVEDVATAGTDISGLKDRMDTAEGNITQAQSDITGLDGRLTTAEGSITTQAGQISDVRNDVEDMVCAYNEPTATSTHTYDIGDYFIYNDVLYQATQQIAISDTIVPDTNCTTTNVSSELLNIKSDINDVETSISGFANESAIARYTESDMIATRNYVVGDYIAVNGNLYRVSTAIVSGAALTVGTNVESKVIKGDDVIYTSNAAGSLQNILQDILVWMNTHLTDTEIAKSKIIFNNWGTFDVTGLADNHISVCCVRRPVSSNDYFALGGTTFDRSTNTVDHSTVLSLSTDGNVLSAFPNPYTGGAYVVL